MTGPRMLTGVESPRATAGDVADGAWRPLAGENLILQPGEKLVFTWAVTGGAGGESTNRRSATRAMRAALQEVPGDVDGVVVAALLRPGMEYVPVKAVETARRDGATGAMGWCSQP